jgi:hypothetical protein
MAGLVPAIHDLLTLPGLTGQSTNHAGQIAHIDYWIPAFAGMTAEFVDAPESPGMTDSVSDS